MRRLREDYEAQIGALKIQMSNQEAAFQQELTKMGQLNASLEHTIQHEREERNLEAKSRHESDENKQREHEAREQAAASRLEL